MLLSRKVYIYISKVYGSTNCKSLVEYENVYHLINMINKKIIIGGYSFGSDIHKELYCKLLNSVTGGVSK